MNPEPSDLPVRVPPRLRKNGLPPVGVMQNGNPISGENSENDLPAGNTEAQKRRLQACNDAIRIELSHVTVAFVKIGNLLETIRTEGLWAASDYDSFPEYLMGEWNWTNSRAQHLISAARTVRSFGLPPGVLPLGLTSERQLRALNILPERERPAAWTEAINSWASLAPKSLNPVALKMPVRHVEQVAFNRAVALGLSVPPLKTPSEPSESISANSTPATPEKTNGAPAAVPDGPVKMETPSDAAVVTEPAFDGVVAKLRRLRSQIDDMILRAEEKDSEKLRAGIERNAAVQTLIAMPKITPEKQVQTLAEFHHQQMQARAAIQQALDLSPDRG